MSSLRQTIRKIIGFPELSREVEANGELLRSLRTRLDRVAQKTHLTDSEGRLATALEEIGLKIDSLAQRIGEDHQLLFERIGAFEDMKRGMEDQRRIEGLARIAVEDHLYDLKRMMLGAQVKPVALRFEAERPLAFDSPDHLEPRGTRNDNTRHPRFVRKAEALIGENIAHLDIGCAGGGLVWDFTLAGHLSVGVEGSDYNLRNARAEWGVIADRLFTADICYPFRVEKANGERQLFNLVSAWELFEHIPTASVDDAIGNIVANMTESGYLVCSIATFVDMNEATGTVFHQTVKPKEWWVEKFKAHGLTERSDLFSHRDFVRGTGNPRAHDWDAEKQPQMGFHLVLQRRAQAIPPITE
jgi:Methyltransferase domain